MKKISDDLYESKVSSSSRSIPKLESKLKAKKMDETKIEKTLKLPQRVATPGKGVNFGSLHK